MTFVHFMTNKIIAPTTDRDKQWVCWIIFHAPVYSKIFNNGLKSDRAENHQLFWAPFPVAQLLREENLSD